MNVEITPTEDPEQLRENLEKQVQKVEREGEKLIATVEGKAEPKLERTPGIKEYETDERVKEGLKGKPVKEQAYARLESRRDLARAVVATIDGYDLRILGTENRWDLKVLRSFNPDIKELKMDEPSEELGIEKTLESGEEDLEQVEIDLDEEEVAMVLEFASLDPDED